ncbi:4'-phosphopantetheinyl transferase superfamily protein [Gammaproteobacteria bacterium LSUCC0112]|nr:4'-phosphopantetheinyl transferase superfamily protein [Gammaproteobacteria bacterium LSUCC0112]
MPAHKIDLWWIPVPDIPVEALYKSCGDILSPDERNRFESQRLRKGQLQFLLTRLSLRYLLSAYQADVQPQQWRILKSETGRPCVDRIQSLLEFNLTHTGQHLLIAFTSAGEPGLDAELSGRSVDAKQVASRYFSIDESRDITDTRPDDQNDLFLRYWTLKEAAVKATGQGLSVALRRFCFSNPTNKTFHFSDTQRMSDDCREEFKFWSSIQDNVALAICLKRHKNIRAGQLKIDSKKLLWPTASASGRLSSLEIEWNET